jgi:hypothetical protein
MIIALNDTTIRYPRRRVACPPGIPQGEDDEIRKKPSTVVSGVVAEVILQGIIF